MYQNNLERTAPSNKQQKGTEPKQTKILKESYIMWKRIMKNPIWKKVYAKEADSLPKKNSVTIWIQNIKSWKMDTKKKIQAKEIIQCKYSFRSNE